MLYSGCVSENVIALLLPWRLESGRAPRKLMSSELNWVNAEALIAGAYLSGTNTRRVRRALKAVFAGDVAKDVVSRTWRKVKADWDAWNSRSLARLWSYSEPEMKEMAVSEAQRI